MTSGEALKASHGQEMKVFDDPCKYTTMCCSDSKKERKRSATPNNNRDRMFSGVSDIVEEYFRSEEDLQLVATEFLQTLDEIPSESSEIFPQILECHSMFDPPLPSPSVFCPQCGRECNRQETSWKCPTKKCSANHEQHLDLSGLHSISTTIKTELSFIKKEPQEPIQERNEESRAYNTVPMVQIKKEIDNENRVPKHKIKIETKQEEEMSTKSKVPKSRKNKLIQSRTQSSIMFDEHTPRQYSLSPPTSPTCRSPAHCKESPSPQPEKKSCPRPKHYKVENTPPIDNNGLRHCTLCKGQVRPQMCGGNKHRWRCVDKQCRKWYGWVKSSEKMPDDLGRKGRFSSILGKTKKKEKSKESNNISSRKSKIKKTSYEISTWGCREKTKTESLGKIPHREHAICNPSDVNKKIKTKRTTQEDYECTEPEERQSRACSPLSPRQINFSPSNMERRGRWWRSERRKYDNSPERSLETTAVNISAALKILSLACRTAAFTRADEMGTVNGALDLMMDSLMGCLGPLLSAVFALPNVQTDSRVVNQMWDASAVHIPIFE